MSTLLERALQMDNLRLAWEEVAENEGSAGVDRISLRVWRRTWEERLVNLARLVRANTYKPKRLRLRRIPKRNRREKRILRIPTVTDRVLQRAVLQVLYPVLEPRFANCSYGYRPRRGLKQAVQQIIVLRENDYGWLLDADIDAFFDNVNHEVLISFLRCDLPDTSLFPLIAGWLELSRSDLKPGMHSKPGSVPKGIPLGSPLSPMWANVYLHRLDQAIMQRGWPMVRYADDFVVFASSSEEAQTIYTEVEAILASLLLRYEPSKTRLASFEEGFDFIGVHFEGDEYSYTYLDKEIKVSGDQVDMLFSQYGPDYW